MPSKRSRCAHQRRRWGHSIAQLLHHPLCLLSFCLRPQSSVPAELLSTATVAVSSSSGLDAGTTGYMLQGTDVAEHLMRRTVTPAQDSIIASSSARAPTTLAGLRQLSLELVRSNIAEGSDSIRSVRNLWGIMRPRKRIPGFSSIRSIGELWVLQWLAPILRPRNTGNFSCFC